MSKAKIISLHDILKEKYRNGLLFFSDVKRYCEIILKVEDIDVGDIEFIITDSINNSNKISQEEKDFLTYVSDINNYNLAIIDREKKLVINEDYLISEAFRNLEENSNFFTRIFKKKKLGHISHDLYYNIHEKSFYIHANGKMREVIPNKAIIYLGLVDDTRYKTDKVLK